jgi:hypothetical protein
MKIGLLSDTHGFLDPRIYTHFADCDQIWHAGDVGNKDIIEALNRFKPTFGVYGNIDGKEVRDYFPEYINMKLEGLKILIIHIGGYPKRYSARALELIKKERPDIFVCGHSHILKVVSDAEHNKMLCINPGAAGRHGFQPVSTIISFEIENGKIFNMKAIELGTKKAL